VFKTKAIIAAGGLGTRLQGFRDNNSTKILLEVNGIPMINLQLNQLINWGLKEFIIITNPTYDQIIKDATLSYTEKYKIQYAIQEKQLGITHALLQAKNYVENDQNILFVLGDNFFGKNPIENLNFEDLTQNDIGSIIFSTEVQNPKDFGVIEVDENQKVLSIEEKPINPKSNKAVVGLYFFDESCFINAERVKPSNRGEYEITDLIDIYIKKNICLVKNLDSWWIDAGTPDRIIELESKLS